MEFTNEDRQNVQDRIIQRMREAFKKDSIWEMIAETWEHDMWESHVKFIEQLVEHEVKVALEDHINLTP